MKQSKSALVLIFWLCLTFKATATEWKSEGNCKYDFGNGSVIDLSPLDNPKEPL